MKHLQIRRPRLRLQTIQFLANIQIDLEHAASHQSQSRCCTPVGDCASERVAALASADRQLYPSSMSERARHVLDEALRLPLTERAKLAAELLASVDGEPDADAEAAWALEIERRAERALSGESQGKDWPIVRAEIEAKRSRK